MLRSILNTFGTRALSAVINLLVAVVLSRYLGPEGKGVTSLIITTITFVLVFANLVGGATLVYLVPRHSPALLLIPSYLWTLLMAALAWGVLQFIPLVEPQFVLHVCLLSILNSFSSIHSTMLIGRERIRQANLLGLMQPVILIAALLLLFNRNGQAGIDSYIQALYASFGATTVLSFVLFMRNFGVARFPQISAYPGVVKEMMKYGILNQAAHITQMLSFRLSFYFIDHYHGEAALGVYSNGISLAESIWLIGKSISLVQYARVANLSDRGEAAALTARLSKVSVLASLVILTPLMLLPSAFYVFLFGPGFQDTRPVIWSLALGVIVYNYAILGGHYFSGTGRYYVNAAISGAGLAVSVLLYYWLIPAYGYLGAGAATSASYLFTSALFVIRFGREHGPWYRMLIPERDDFAQLKKILMKFTGSKR